MKKTKAHDKYKYYKNLISTVIQKSKTSYYNQFFKTNMNNIRNTWKGIRNLIPWRQSVSPYIHVLSQDNETASNPKKIVSIFNDYFSAIEETTKVKVRFSNKSFVKFLQQLYLFIRKNQN